jgi:hypothetical protein
MVVETTAIDLMVAQEAGAKDREAAVAATLCMNA